MMKKAFLKALDDKKDLAAVIIEPVAGNMEASNLKNLFLNF